MPYTPLPYTHPPSIHPPSTHSPSSTHPQSKQPPQLIPATATLPCLPARSKAYHPNHPPLPCVFTVKCLAPELSVRARIQHLWSTTLLTLCPFCPHPPPLCPLCPLCPLAASSAPSLPPLSPPPPSFPQLHEVRQGLVKLNGRLETPLPSIGNFLAFLHEWLLY